MQQFEGAEDTRPTVILLNLGKNDQNFWPYWWGSHLDKNEKKNWTNGWGVLTVSPLGYTPGRDYQ